MVKYVNLDRNVVQSLSGLKEKMLASTFCKCNFLTALDKSVSKRLNAPYIGSDNEAKRPSSFSKKFMHVLSCNLASKTVK